jgi:hypothetical protein
VEDGEKKVRFDSKISRRRFFQVAAGSAAGLGSIVISGRRALARPVARASPFLFPTPIFRVDHVKTYTEQIGPEPLERTGASSTAPDPNPDDPSIAPGAHYYHQGLEDLLGKMALSGHPLWRSAGTESPPALPLQFPLSGTEQDGGFGVGIGSYGGPDGLFGRDDIIIIKINAVSSAHCMVNVDVLKGLIQRLVDHPDGFTGEIIVLDKFFDDEPPNSFHARNTVSAVCNSFPDFLVSRVALRDRVWHDRMMEEVKNGYVELEDLFPDAPFFERVSYPKFTTRFGTHIDLKLGWWNGTRYDSDRVKLIGYSVLKDQRWTAVTCCLKNFLGITNIGTEKFGGSENDPENGWQRTHEGIYKSGLLGRILRYVRSPDLLLVDATRILAQHPLGPLGVGSPYVQPGVLLAGFDPVNVDYYAAKSILLEQPTVVPCRDIAGPGFPPVCQSNPSVTTYPCSSSGKCARHDPDFVSTACVHPLYQGFPGFRMREPPPLDAFRRYLAQSSSALYGGVFVGTGFFQVI